jgi:hypothetical protein
MLIWKGAAKDMTPKKLMHAYVMAAKPIAKQEPVDYSKN